MRISVGDRRLSDTTGHVADGAQLLNGNCEFAAEQGLAATDSSQTRAVRPSHSSDGSMNNPGMKSDNSESAYAINGEVNARNEISSSQTSSCSQLSDGSPTQNSVGDRSDSDFVLVAAGHENAIHGQQKRQRKDHKSNKSTEQMHSSCRGAVAASPVEPPQTSGDIRSTYTVSVSARQRAQAGSASDSVTVGYVSGHGQNHTPSNAAVVAADTAHQAEADAYRSYEVSQPSSNNYIGQTEYDIIPSDSQIGTSASPADISDVIVPLRSNQHDIVSPSYSDRSPSDVVTGGEMQQNHVDFSNRSGIGRGQLLLRMLNSKQHLSNNG